MTNYYEFFARLKEQLEKNPNVEIDHFKIRKGLPKANINMIEKEYNIIIPKSIREIYSNIASVDFLWTLKEGTKIPLLDQDDFGNVNGKAYIPDLDTVFDGGSSSGDQEAWENVFWFPDSMDKDTIEENKKVRPIDFYDNNGGECICLLKEKTKKISDKIYLRNNEGVIMDFNLDIFSYIDLMIKMKGFVNFQIAYLAKKSYENKKLKYYFPKIFPEADLKEFE